MGQILEAELRLVGNDKTAALFAGVIKHAEEMKRALAGAAGVKLDDAGARARAAALRQSTTALRAERLAAMEVARAYAAGNEAIVARGTLMQRMSKRFPAFASVAGMGWMAGGIASGRLAHSIAHDTADFAHQKALLESSSGMKPEEVSRAIDQSLRLRVPGLSAAENLKAIGELRMVFGSTEHAIEHLAAVQRASAIMKAVNPQMDGENESYNLARALELKGVSSDPKHFTRLANMMVQAVNASRGKVTGSEFFEFTKYARGAAARLTDQFYTRVAPTLIQELGGHSAGMALSSFRQTLVGGKMTNKAAEEFVRLGLVDPKAVIHTKTGSIKGIRPGGLVDSALANQDPYAWIQGYLKPALAKSKITDPDKIAEELAHLFSNRFSEQMASILLNQSQRIEKDYGLIEGAPSVEALEKLRESDPQAALHDLSTGITSLLAALGSPMVGPAVAVMNKMADGARNLAERYANFAKANPGMALEATGLGAAGLGYVGLKGAQATFGLLTGATALKGSAAALDGSAAALMRAGAVLEARPGGIGSGPANNLADREKPRNLGKFLLREGGKAAAWVEILRDIDAFIYDNMSPEQKSAIKAHEERINSLKPDHRLSHTELLRETFNRERSDLGLPALSGSADINIKVSAGDGLIAEIVHIIKNEIDYLHINGYPSTGTSGSRGIAMPEALPTGP